MPISQTKYINIQSTAAGVPAVSQRELIGRVFTSNKYMPKGVREFDRTQMEDIADMFGRNSIEYMFASRYFGFVSKRGTRPQKICFARTFLTETPAINAGFPNYRSLTELQSITDGNIAFYLTTPSGMENVSVDGLNLSTATSFTEVASIINTAMDNENVSLTYDTATSRFVLTTVGTGNGYVIGNVGGIGFELGLNSPDTSIAGSDPVSPVESIETYAEASNNFFSFCFLREDTELSAAQIQEIAQWTHNQNVRYMFCTSTLDKNEETATEKANGLAEYDGVVLAYGGWSMNHMPMAAIAAIDYTKPNSTIDLMYQQFDSTGIATISTNADSNLLDGLKINYYGITQQAGRRIGFYQNGVMQGSISSIGVFANEAWLKDSFFTNLLNLRLGLDSLPANQTGKSLVLNVMADTIEQALYNGTILAGKTLNATQKATITQISGDENAWMAVQSAGYWLTAEVEQYTEDGVQKYKVSYVLVYSKGDSINFIDGSDILI